MRKEGNKRGQVTIFIIIAVLVVGLVALAYFLIPKSQTGATFDVKNPYAFIQSCLSDKLKTVVDTVSSQGGSMSPETYFKFNEIHIEYLCYTNENNKLCTVQPDGLFLQKHIETEIESNIANDADTCFTNLQENYRVDGYDVSLDNGVMAVSLLPNKVIVDFRDYSLTVTKSETSVYDKFSVVLDNNLYELVAIANNIVEWEATAGGADPRVYMTYYSYLKVGKNQRDDGTNIYSVEDRNTGDIFQFATRSMAQPIMF